MLIHKQIGELCYDKVNAIIEIPKDTSAKYEYDSNLDMFRLDRCLISSMRYPLNYGFIPQTIAEDGDPLDIMIYNSVPIDRGTFVECRILGCMNMVDTGIHDYKILGVPMFNPNKYTNYTDLDKIALHIFEDFFCNYKNLEGKKVVINGWTNKEGAVNIIKESNNKYYQIYHATR